MPTTVATPEDIQSVRDDLAVAQADDDYRLSTIEAGEVDEEVREGDQEARLAATAAALKSTTDALTAQDARIKALETAAPATGGTTTGTAYVGMPYTVIGNGTPPTDAALQAGIKKWIDNRSGNFLKSHLLLNWVGRASVTTPLLKYLADTPTIPQIQGARIQGLAKRATDLGWNNATTPLLTSNGDLRNFQFKDLTFTSTAAAATPSQGLLFLSSTDTATGSDGKFKRVEFMGAWDYGVAFDGNVTANLNSEMVFDQFACGQSFSSVRGLVVVGLSGNDPQEDQFLNYTFRDTKLEGSHGDYLVFNKGGSITIEGFNSWIHTGTSNLVNGVATPKGTMLKMPVTSHFDSVQTLTASHIRAELRGTQSKFMDCGWTSRAQVILTGLDTGAYAYHHLDNEDITIRNGARVHLIGASLGGYIALRDKGGEPILDGVENIANNCSLTCTDGTGKGIVRNFTTTAAPAVSFR
jgi:hypothetical protein